MNAMITALKTASVGPQAVYAGEPARVAEVLPGFEKFAYDSFTTPRTFAAAHSSLVFAPTVTGNLPGYQMSARHSG